MPPNVQITPPPVNLVMPHRLCTKFTSKRFWSVQTNEYRSGERQTGLLVGSSRKSWALEQRLKDADADAFLDFYRLTNYGQKSFWFYDVWETIPRFTPLTVCPLLGETNVTWDASEHSGVTSIAILQGVWSDNWQTDGTLSRARVFVAPTTTLANPDVGPSTGFTISAGVGFWLMNASNGKDIRNPANALDWTAMSVVSDLAQEGGLTFGPNEMLATADNPCFVAPGHAPGIYSVRFDSLSQGITRNYSMGRHDIGGVALLEVL
jgi:hypothetical protein